MHAFYNQVHEFCGMMHQELARRWQQLPEPSSSIETALAFTEKFLLCPTAESARACIARDFSGALSFASAVDEVNRSLERGEFELPPEYPRFQTCFYVLSCAVQEHLRALHV
jgi:hypothetical protein